MPVAEVSASPLRLELTPAQLEIWIEQCLHPENTQYVLCTHYDIPTAVDAPCLVAAVDWVLNHADALYARLRVGDDGVPRVVLDPTNAAKCEYRDFSAREAPGAELDEELERHMNTPFVLLDAPLTRAFVVKIAASSYRCIFIQHHIMVDAWGLGVVFSRVAEVYAALREGRVPPAGWPQYADFAARSRQTSSEEAVAFWREAFAAPQPPVPQRHALPPGGNGLETANVERTLPRELADRVARLAAQHDATLYHALLLAYGQVMVRQYSLEACALTLPILNRSKAHKETIGFFTETRTVGLPLDEAESLAANLTAMARRIRRLYRYFRLPADRLVALRREAGHEGPSVGAGAVSYITRDYGAALDGVWVPMRERLAAQDSVPLSLYAIDIYPGQDVRLRLAFQRSRMDAFEADLFLARLVHFLGQLCEAPDTRLGELDLVPPEEKRMMVGLLDRTAELVQATSPIVDAILEQALRHPDRIAVEEESGSRTYGECVARASAIARSLVAEGGVVPGDRVALLLPRGADLVSAQLGVMLAGAAFVPLELGNPDARLRGICEDAGARCVVTNRAGAERAERLGTRVLAVEACAAAEFSSRADLDLPAYLIYTSGSTGRPKGVEISHRALADHMASWFLRYRPDLGADRFLWFFSPGFDASIEGVFPVLLAGHTLVVAPSPPWSAYELPKVILEKRLSGLFLPPAYLLEMLKGLQERSHAIAGHRITLCQAGGEAMASETALLWNSVFGDKAALYNVYGPTEATVTAAIYRVPADFRASPGESVPIGRVHPGRVLRIVRDGRDVPFGAEGELLIGGLGLATCYHGMPEATERAFFTDETGRRFYRSGDIVRLRSDGQLAFCRRADDQVKIRGYRIELGEVAACLQACPDVRECIVLACPVAGPDGRELRAFVVPESPTVGTERMRAHLQQHLPAYMVPVLVCLERLPRTTAGKVDRAALLSLAPSVAEPASADRAVAPPRGPVQEYLVALWEEALGRKVPDVGADFFDLGGHSLLAAKLIAKTGKAFRVELPFAAFFEKPTIEATERRLEALVGGRARLEKIATLRIQLARLSPEEVAAQLQRAGRQVP